MNQQYYEIQSNFASIYNVALALMKGRGHNEICQFLSDTKVSVVNTDFDNWNGGTYGYTVYISMSVKRYSSFSSDKIAEMEKVIAESLNEVIKKNPNDYFNVQISPTLSEEDIDWNVIGGLNGRAALKQNIEIIRNIMVSVATGGNRIQEEEERYKKLHVQAQRDCEKLNLTYNNSYSSLWDWYGKWKSDFSTYQERRAFINDLFSPTLSYFEENANNNIIEIFVELDGWEKIKRTVAKIKLDSNIAQNEEDFQSVGLLCREVIITLGQTVYNPNIHGRTDDNGIEISKTDAVRMIGNYINVQLAGASNEELRAYAKNTNKLANRLTHERNATKKEMLLAVSSTIALINFVGIIEDKF
jgi:hypothetical protein